jgi:hypothetical protein
VTEVTCAKRSTFECRHWHDGKRAREGDRGAAQPVTAILKDERGITGDTAIRLGTFFKTSAEFWMNLQMTYDLRNAEKAPPARVRKGFEDNRSVLA